MTVNLMGQIKRVSKEGTEAPRRSRLCPPGGEAAAAASGGSAAVCEESVTSAVLKVALIRPGISTPELHCAATLRPREVDHTGRAPQQDGRVQRDEES